MKDYFIKAGYQCNLSPTPVASSPEESMRYQLAVYRYAADCIAKFAVASVLDVGCGLGLKLRSFILPTGASITGVDKGDRIDYCKAQHSFGRWFQDDIESPSADLGGAFDLAICADVIEHLIDPDRLFSYLKRWSHCESRVLLSTPERDLRRGLMDAGPPANPAHVREWNANEFQNYLRSRHLKVADFRIVDLRAGFTTCQLALCSWEREED